MPDAVNQKQEEHFRKITKMIEADEDEKRWEKRLKKVVKPKPSEKGQ